MEEQFWAQAWKEGRTGFHKDRPHDFLQEHIGTFKGRNVLVPLCGKSLDILYLKEHAQHVVGVELSGLALDQFESENNLSLTQSKEGDFTVRQMPGLTLYEGNFFTLPRTQKFEAIYDRAAAIALPPQMRCDYFKVLTEHLAPAGEILMIILTSDHPAPESQFGPPFFIPLSEIKENFSSLGVKVEILEARPTANIPERYRERGYLEIAETLLRLSKS